ncbi:FAD-dependent oxidoreductase [Massilibacteroides sp.]|uniref:FAD-dependent oxidoreductase n=1 Tax=Massilibacteroides sp. TaxID=2034766 RepID=UPI00262D5537|nr:FAD-dependent oxidoreductase [Massilibacteroides sp.]MDD4514046.1 FAD-dependent oxidoreductase [Massilibacteroides sp.]
MEFIREKQREIPVIARPDVLVVGAGPSGLGAAIAAAKNGAHTMLIEKYGFPGGNLTTSMVNPIFTFHDINGRQVIRGIAGEIVEQMIASKASIGHVTDLTFDNASMTPFDPERTKVILFDMLEEAGVDLLFHTLVTDAEVKDGIIEYVVIENKSGRQAICPKYIIDCSGDADVAAFSNVPFTKGREEDGAMQPATLYFRVGNIDNTELRKWMKNNRNLLKDNPTDEEIDSQKAIAFLGLHELVDKAIADGDLDSEVAPRILMYELPNNQFSVNSTRLQNVDATNAKDLTQAEILLRKQVLQVHDFLKKKIGGFAQSNIIDTGIQVGTRESRHIKGDYILTEDDILQGTTFNDGIACGTFAIDIHPPKGKQQIFTGSGRVVYEVPYRCLLPKGIDNLLVAGKTISATHTAFGSIRVMATCIATGEGAGTAAALLNRKKQLTREIDIAILKKTLIKNGQYLLNGESEENRDESLILKRVNGSGEKAAHYNPFKKSK